VERDPDAAIVEPAEAMLEAVHPSRALGIAEAQAWVTRIAHAEDVEPPVLMHGPLVRRVLAAALTDDHVIVVRSTRPTQLTLLHELAHLLGSAGHGPHFRRVYGDLIARYLSPAHAAVFTCSVSCRGRRP